MKFDAALRRAVARILRRPPRLDDASVVLVIAHLEKAAECARVIQQGPDRADAGPAFDRLMKTLRPFRRELERVQRAGLLDIEKRSRGYGPDFEARLLEGLDILAALQAEARPRRRRPREGRPRAGESLAGRWLARQVADILRDQGGRPTAHRDGPCADLLRALWVPVLGGHPLPDDIRRLLLAAIRP